MPELPEVETIATNLRRGTQEFPSLLGMEVARGQVLWSRTLAQPGVEEFERRLPGQIVEDVGRRGKYLMLKLSRDHLLIHLRMSGDLFIERANSAPANHHRMILIFNGGCRLAFNDPRKFGRVWLVTDPSRMLDSLGPEPLDESFTSSQLYGMLQARHRQLKPLLLDQSFVAGLGNIYTDEALHMASLHPLVVSNTLDAGQADRLWVSIRQVLREGIRRNGASIDWVYRGGDFQNYFRVYQRTGQPCPVCGTAIERIVVGQRGTHLCPRCQPAPG